MDKMDKYIGIHPEPDAWVMVGETKPLYGVSWVIYLNKSRINNWDNYKLVANGYSNWKANYYISWDGTWFGDGKCYLDLSTHRPLLLDALKEYIENK